LFGDELVGAPPQARRYRTIYADPSWQERGGGEIKRGADRHYGLMSTEAICALPAWRWAAADAHLYLWVTNNFLEDGFRVIKAWGFEYVTTITWFKGDVIGLEEVTEASGDKADTMLQVGLGQYFRGVTEPCLFAVRGSLPYRELPGGKRAQGRTGFHAPRGRHSEKPAKMRRMIETVSHGPYLEMFCRQPAPGWDAWGNEIPDRAVSA
jgi:N6-adenosine-specific RNA methylase IME4